MEKTACPRCGSETEKFVADEFGLVDVCRVCHSVWLTGEQLEASRRYVSPSEVIEAYGLGQNTVYTAIRREWIPSERVGGRILLRLTDVVKRWGPWPEEGEG